MAWGKNGTPDTLGSAGDLLSISDMTATKFNMFMTHILATGTTDVHLEIDDDTTATYASRTNYNGGTDSTQLSQSTLEIDNNVTTPVFWINYMVNIATEEKLGIMFEIRQSTAGAGTAPDRQEKIIKWTNTSVQFTKYEHTNDEAGSFDTSSNLSALGSDITPAAAIPALTNVQDNSLFIEPSTAKRYWFDADATYTTVEAGATADSNGGSSYITYKQITGLTAGDLISHVTFDVYNTPANTSYKGGVYTDSGNNPVTLLASGELTNQNITTTYTTLSIPLTSNATVPSSGIVWVGIVPNKTNQLIRVTTASANYTNSKYDASSTGSYTNYANLLTNTATVQGSGENNVRFGVKIYHAPTWTIESPPTAGLKLWLDASDSTTITKDGSDLVSAWNDKSGQLNHVSQATATNRPLWVDAVYNSLPTIRFDGVDNYMFRNTWTGGSESQPNTVFIVCKIPTGTATKFIFDSLHTGGRNSFFVTGNPSLYSSYCGVTANFGTKNTAFAQFMFEFNGSSTFVRRNKTSIGSSLAVGSLDMSGIYLASNGAATIGEFADIDISEVLVYSGQLSTTDRDDIEQYLTAKWGL